MHKPDAAIFDMDGTLCDVSSIRHHVNPNDPRFSGQKRFDLFHAGSIDCPPNETAVEILRNARADGVATLIVTARKTMWRFHTILWLHEQQLDYDELFMRGDDDNRKDYLVKRDLLDAMRHRYNIVLAVDDNPAVIALWQAEGIPTIRIPGWEE